VKFNINDSVKVKLTDLGKEIYYHQHNEINEYYGKEMIKPKMPEVDEDGYTSFQMWCLMGIYGKHISIGFNQPFETNIILEDE